MPYIRQDQRECVDSKIDDLLQAIFIVSKPTPPEQAGVLNYTITRLILGAMHKALNGTPSYSALAVYSGVLHNVYSEFYRRVISPYEDKKIKENGDLQGF